MISTTVRPGVSDSGACHSASKRARTPGSDTRW